jgi:hypothetical protein
MIAFGSDIPAICFFLNLESRKHATHNMSLYNKIENYFYVSHQRFYVNEFMRPSLYTQTKFHEKLVFHKP